MAIPYVVTVRFSGPDVFDDLVTEMIGTIERERFVRSCARAGTPEGWEVELRLGVVHGLAIDALVLAALTVRQHARRHRMTLVRVSLSIT